MVEITDYILVNMLKTQLVEIYSYYKEKRVPNPVFATMEDTVFETLVEANTVKDFKYWLDRAKVSDFSYLCVDGTECQNNILGEFVDLALEANEATISEFIEWKKTVSVDYIEHVAQRNGYDVSKVMDALDGDHDAHVVIVGSGRNWFAMGVDAERLFQIYGWQPGYVLDKDESSIPFMYITKYGLDVLRRSPYTVEYIEVDDVNIISESFLEDETCCAQQILDYLRVVEKDMHKLHKFVDRGFPIIARYGTHPRLLRVLNMHMSSSEITTRLDTGEVETLASDNNWRLDGKHLPLCIALAKQWEENGD